MKELCFVGAIKGHNLDLLRVMIWLDLLRVVFWQDLLKVIVGSISSLGGSVKELHWAETFKEVCFGRIC